MKQPCPKKIIDNMSSLYDLRSSNPYQSSSMSDLCAHIALKYNGIEVFKTKSDIPMGYVCYGKVSKESITRGLKFGKLPTKLFEYNEGHITFVTEILLDRNWRDQCRSYLKEFLVKQRIFCFVRRNRFVVMFFWQGKIRKISRKDFGS